MSEPPDGNAVVYCDAAFRSASGKTAHGLVRRTTRYRVTSVLDSTCAGEDAGALLDGRPAGIPVVATLAEAIDDARRRGHPLDRLVIGLAPDGGRLGAAARGAVAEAIGAGLHVDSGLHDYLSDDPQLAAAAARRGVVIRDVRKPPPVASLHFFSGKIDSVAATRIAVLGTDSAVGKRTTAWLLVDALREAGHRAELVGTGQTAWMQGARYGLILDSLVNDFVAGEIEHTVWSAWRDGGAGVVVIEGQGSIMHPAYPGGFEILAAARPHAVVVQHAPARREYDGFPGRPIHPLERQLEVIELLCSDASRPAVAAIAINHEDLRPEQVRSVCEEVAASVGRPAIDVLRDGAGGLVDALGAVLPPLAARGG